MLTKQYFPEYFKLDELVVEKARYIVWFASFSDPFRDFILTVFNYYHSLTAFSWRNIGNDQKKAEEEFDKDKDVQKVDCETVEAITPSHPSSFPVFEKLVLFSLSQPEQTPSQASVDAQASTLQN